MNGFFRNVLLLTGFYTFQGLIFTILFFNSEWLSTHSLLNWDAQHYLKIADEGYDYTRTAFFPLFPLLWKYSGMSTLAVSIFNGILFIIAFAWLAYEFKVSYKRLLLIASIPSFIFFFVPYSESVFFFSSAIALCGYKKENYRLVFAGLLLASFARPAASVFVPAIIILETLTRMSFVDAIKKTGVSILAVVIGMFAAFAVHKYYTGSWVGFFDVQANVWENKLQLPSLPLRSWAGIKIVILDGVALFVALISAWQLLRWLIPDIKQFKIRQEKALIFSLLYLCGIGLLVLLYRDGSLFSLNRFTFATAFFVVSAIYFSEQKFNNRALIWILVLLVWWLLFNSFVHIATFSKHFIVTAFLSLTVMAFHQNKRVSDIFQPLLLVGFSILQLYFMYRHLNNLWVG